jgi:hypothetical protein
MTYEDRPGLSEAEKGDQREGAPIEAPAEAPKEEPKEEEKK